MFRKRYAYALAFAGTLAVAVPTFAQKPANAPANATAQCADGTYSTAKTQTGACSRHGGVKVWWGAADTKSSTSAKSPKTPAAGTAAKSGGSVPAGATGQCADGSYTRAKTQTGACSRHGGVKTWFAAETSQPSAPTAVTPTPAAPSTPKPAPTPAPKPAPVPSPKPATTAAPAGAPAGATARCKDGTYSMSKTHSGACSHHGGVAEWYR